MTTFLEIAKKLPPRLLAFRARLQLAIAWANILLQRRAPADAALNRFEAALAAQNSRMRREPIFEWKPTWCAECQTYSPTVVIVSILLSPRRAPYQDMMGPFASVLAHSWAGIAAKYELDIPTARREFREAFEIGTRVGSRSQLRASRARCSANCFMRLPNWMTRRACWR